MAICKVEARGEPIALQVACIHAAQRYFQAFKTKVLEVTQRLWVLVVVGGDTSARAAMGMSWV